MLQTKLLEKKKIAHDTWEFVFERPKDFDFIAGQFTTLFLGKDNRDFTICLHENNKKSFSIVTRSLRSGQAKMSSFKERLFSLPERVLVNLSKPSGGFTLSPTPIPKVFLAGGIGITVFYSIISSHKDVSIPITLLASFSKMTDMIFYHELQALAKENKNIQVIYTLTQDTWDKETGRISENLLKKYIPHIKKAEYMIAGGEKMVEDTEKLLLNMGILQENIRIDIFTGYE